MQIKYALGIHGKWTDLKDPKIALHKRVEDLEKRLVKIDTPQFDKSQDPTYESWEKTLDNLDFSKYDAILTVSYGGWVVVKYIKENNIKINRLVMMCPWRSKSKKENTWKLYDYLDKNDVNLTKLVNEIFVINSKDDEAVPPENWKKLAKQVWAKFIQLDWYWHAMKWNAIEIINNLVVNWKI